MWKWFHDNSTPIVALATVVLAIVTIGYLIETRNMRKIAEQSFEIDNSPKVFLAEAVPIASLNGINKSIEITLVLKFKNTGKTEAKELTISYELTYQKTKDKTMTVEGKFPIEQYLFPNQEITQETKMLRVELGEDNFAMAKKLVEAKRKVRIIESRIPDLYFNLKFSYLDQNKKEVSYNYPYKYIFQENKLVYNYDKLKRTHNK